jgi:hypothetical protein
LGHAEKIELSMSIEAIVDPKKGRESRPVIKKKESSPTTVDL